jgi:hypothetical protein
MKVRIMALAAVFAVCLATPSFGQAPLPRNEEARQPVIVEVSEGGFRWGDAAIGAAAASGAAIVLAGLSLARRHLPKDGVKPERRETR